MQRQQLTQDYTEHTAGMQEEINSQNSGSHQKDCPNLAGPQPAKCIQPH